MIDTNGQILENLQQTKVEELATQGVLTVYEGWSIKKLSEFFAKHRISGAPVVAADESLVGVVTHTDIIDFDSKTPNQEEIEKIIHHYIGPSGVIHQSEIDRIKSKAVDYCTVNSIMTPKVFSIEASSSVASAYSLIEKNNIHRLFVTKNSVLIGVITAMDILRAIVKS